MAKYLVVEQDFEYNDSTYDIHEGYNIVSKMYDNEEDAKKMVEDLNDNMPDEYVDYDNNPIKPYKVVKVEEE